MMSCVRLGVLLAALGPLATIGSAQTAMGRRPAVSDLIAVFGDRPLADSAVAILTREGFTVADRSPGFIERARQRGERLAPARLAVVVLVRYDSLVRAPIVVAELLNVETLNRLGLASARWPDAGQPWGDVLAKLLRQVMKP